MISRSHWYVVHTQPREERRAERNLRIQRYTVFAPFLRRNARHARQWKTTEVPLFPGYIFVKLDLARDRWLSINGTAGVTALLAVRDRPLPLPEGLVEALIAGQRGRSTGSDDEELHVSESVQLNGDPFAGLVGRIEHVDAKGRVQVLLEIMGRAVPVQTHRSQLRPAPEPAAARHTDFYRAHTAR
jgi:transcriptional antiterminator RfaH